MHARILSGFLCLFGSFATAAEFSWQTDEDRGVAELRYGDQPVLRYMFAYDPSTPERLHETYKVYHHVFGPGTDTPITKGPGGLYTHHRGLFVGWNKTSWDGGQGDFWHCTNGAHQEHVKFVNQQADAEQGSMTSIIDWVAGDGKPVIEETRTVTVHKFPTDSQPGFGWQIDWSTKLESRRGEITLDGDRQHAGFQFRAANVVAEQNSARYLRPAGFPDQEDAFEVNDATDPDKHVDLGWLAMHYEDGGKPYTVGYFEDPSVPKPSRYSERPYGRFGAFFKTTISEDQPLTMRDRVLVTTEPAMSRDVWQTRYESFLADLKTAKP
jgi:hypothetical protein